MADHFPAPHVLAKRSHSTEFEGYDEEETVRVSLLLAVCVGGGGGVVGNVFVASGR
jgi:hypothetical protein